MWMWKIAQKNYVNKIEKNLTIETQAEFTFLLRKKWDLSSLVERRNSRMNVTGSMVFQEWE